MSSARRRHRPASAPPRAPPGPDGRPAPVPAGWCRTGGSPPGTRCPRTVRSEPSAARCLRFRAAASNQSASRPKLRRFGFATSARPLYVESAKLGLAVGERLERLGRATQAVQGFAHEQGDLGALVRRQLWRGEPSLRMLQRKLRIAPAKGDPRHQPAKLRASASPSLPAARPTLQRRPSRRPPPPATPGRSAPRGCPGHPGERLAIGRGGFRNAADTLQHPRLRAKDGRLRRQHAQPRRACVEQPLSRRSSNRQPASATQPWVSSDATVSRRRQTVAASPRRPCCCSSAAV